MKPLAIRQRRDRKLVPYFAAVVAPYAPHVWLREAWREGPDEEQIVAVLDAAEVRELRDWLTAALPHLSKSRTKARSKRTQRAVRTGAIR